MAEDEHLLAQLIVAQLRVQGIAADQARPPSHQGVLDAARGTGYDVVVLALDLDGDRDGALPLIGSLRQTGARVVLLAGASEGGPRPECLQAGASGWVGKTAGVAELLAAVQDALAAASSRRGDPRDARQPEPRDGRRDDDRGPASFERLTRRERQVLAALMDGRSARAIAAERVVSYETVRTQIRSVLRKLGVGTQLEAVVVAQRAGWPGPDERSSLSA